MACRNDHAHPDIASSAVYRGKVLLELGVGHFGEILLQLSHDLVLGRRIERVAKITKSMRRRDEHEAVELRISASLALTPPPKSVFSAKRPPLRLAFKARRTL